MNDDARFERLFAEGLHDIAPLRAPDRLRTQVKAESSRVHPRPRWLALIKEPPMRTNSRLAVGSPTARVAAIMVATLLATLLVVSASIAGSRILAADGPIVVDQTGNGTYTTITEAVDAAVDGDEILVKPGVYTEAVVIDKDITLRGDGPVDEIIMTAPEGGPEALLWEFSSYYDPYALLVSGVDATISGLTFTGVGSSVVLDGGSPSLHDTQFQGVGTSYTGGTSPSGSSVVVTNGAAASVRENSIRDGGPIAVFGDANATIDANRLSAGAHIFLADYGPATVVSGNVIEDTIMWAIGAFDGESDAHLVIRNNEITNPGQSGINLSAGSADIVGNEIRGASTAAIMTGLGLVSITGNTLMDNRNAIVDASGEATISDNVIRGGESGVVVSGVQAFSGNDVEGVERGGIVIPVGSPVLRGNRSCGNGTNLIVADTATPDIDDSNEICEDAPAG